MKCIVCGKRIGTNHKCANEDEIERKRIAVAAREHEPSYGERLELGMRMLNQERNI